MPVYYAQIANLPVEHPNVHRTFMYRGQIEPSTPPRAYPGYLTVHHARGGGNLNVALEGWGI